HMEDKGLLAFVGLAVAACRCGDQRDDMLVVGDEVVEVLLDLLVALGVIDDVLHDRLFPAVLTAKLRRSISMPHRVVGELVADCLDIAAFERVEAITDGLNPLLEAELGSGFRHLRPPLSPFGEDPATRPGWPCRGPAMRCGYRHHSRRSG